MALLCLALLVCGCFAFERNASPLTGRSSKPSHPFALKRQAQEVCKDKGVCVGNETCCGSPSECCSGGAECCGTGENTECCEAPLEGCCADPVHGSICCLTETTFCCPADPPSLPSRCCPRWNVCCPGGRYGCCDPGNLRVAEDNYAFALFGAGSLEGEPLKLLSIDLNTGDKKATVTSYPTHGDLPRTFAWSSTSATFFQPQANFLEVGENVTLWKVSAPNGTLNHVDLTPSSPSGLVTGYCTTSSGAVIMATYNVDKSGYLFFSVSASGESSLLTTRLFSGSDDYSGWFKRCNSQGNILFRLGFQNPVSEDNFGVSLTTISSSTSAFKFISLQAPAGLASYATLDLVSGSSEADFEFLSLAGAGNSDGDFSLVRWDLHGGAKVVAELKDAHEAVKFGPISSAVNDEGTQFGALVTTRSLLGDKFDRWKAVLVSLVSGAVVEHDLSPWMIAETDSAAGFGFPAKTTKSGLEIY